MEYQQFTIDTSHSELNLIHSLMSGQAFRWKQEPDGWWRAVVRGTLVGIRAETPLSPPLSRGENGGLSSCCDSGETSRGLSRGEDGGFECFTLPEPGRLDIIREYFRLDDDIAAIYAGLAAADEHTGQLVERFRGLRLLRQEPEEALLSFCCSAANSIPRISRAIEELSARYGRHVATWRGQNFYAFPTASALAAASADELANIAGLGFRGQNLSCVARQLLERPPGWLESLKMLPYRDANRELTSLRCIGRKIADCVCLFALGHDEAVPVDTHIRQIVARLYLPEMKARSVTDSVYNACVRVFQDRFGRLAGWAQQFLYYEDLTRRNFGGGSAAACL